MNAKTLVAIAAMLATTSISAAEIKVLASNGVKEALNELAPAFERATGNKLVISFGLATALKRQRSEEHTSELQSLAYLVCRLLLEKKKTTTIRTYDSPIILVHSTPRR